MADKPKKQASVGAPAFAVDEQELKLIDLALAEDQGPGDWTTRWIVPARTRASAVIVAKADGVISGMAIASAVFLRLDPRVDILTDCVDGSSVVAGDVVCTIKGPARVILTGERTALNFLQRLSGIATLTRRFVQAIAGTNAEILDTRKTTPAWRSIEKAAVRAGGGRNHRTGLYDMVLIKENHIAIAGGVGEAIRRIRDANEQKLQVEVEVRNLEELKAAIDEGCDIILLDNMSTPMMREAVAIVRKRAPRIKTEASGNMSLERVREVAETGVDFISVGALTHSVHALDLSLQMKSG